MVPGLIRQGSVFAITGIEGCSHIDLWPGHQDRLVEEGFEEAARCCCKLGIVGDFRRK